MNNKDFIADLKKSDFMRYILNKEDIICVFLGGSRSNNLDDNESDFDLVVVTETKPLEESERFCMEYKGKSVHWYYRSIKQLITTSSNADTILSYYSGINLRNFENNLIYQNPLYKGHLQWLIDHKTVLVNFNCWQFVLNHSLFYSLLLVDKIEPELQLKSLYHFATCNFFIFNKEIDYDFLKRVKRIQKTEDSEQKEEDLKRVLSLVKELENYRRENDLQLIKTERELLDSLFQL